MSFSMPLLGRIKSVTNRAYCFRTYLVFLSLPPQPEGYKTRLLVLVREHKLKNKRIQHSNYGRNWYSRDYRYGRNARNNWHNVYSSALLEEASKGFQFRYRYSISRISIIIAFLTSALQPPYTKERDI